MTVIMEPRVMGEPRVGVAVFIMNSEGKFIIGKRMGSHGAGTWGLPGGHLEKGEPFEVCAARESLEETGLNVTDLEFITATNDVMESEGKHYVTIFMKGVLEDSTLQPQILEPEKCQEWKWLSWEELGAQKDDQMQAGSGFGGPCLFSPLVTLLEKRNKVAASALGQTVEAN